MSESTEPSRHSRWDERYSGDAYLFGTQPNRFLASVSPDLPRGRTLCYADGEGRNSVYLAREGHTVTAMDASPVGVQKASRLALTHSVSLTTVVADLKDFDFGQERWDTIVSVFVHLPSGLRRDVHQRAARALRPGGVFVLEAYTPDQLRYRTGGPPDVDRLMTLEAVREDLKGLVWEIGRETVRDVVEGRGHHGRAAVLQILARKPA